MEIILSFQDLPDEEYINVTKDIPAPGTTAQLKIYETDARELPHEKVTAEVKDKYGDLNNKTFLPATKVRYEPETEDRNNEELSDELQKSGSGVDEEEDSNSLPYEPISTPEGTPIYDAFMQIPGSDLMREALESKIQYAKLPSSERTNPSFIAAAEEPRLEDLLKGGGSLKYRRAASYARRVERRKNTVPVGKVEVGDEGDDEVTLIPEEDLKDQEWPPTEWHWGRLSGRGCT